jgi:hypothetical protein
MQATPLAIALSSAVPLACLAGLALCVALLIYLRDVEQYAHTVRRNSAGELSPKSIG